MAEALADGEIECEHEIHEVNDKCDDINNATVLDRHKNYGMGGVGD